MQKLTYPSDGNSL